MNIGVFILRKQLTFSKQHICIEEKKMSLTIDEK